MRFQHVFGQTFSLTTTIAEVVFGLVIAAMLAAFAQSWWRHRRGRDPSHRSERNRLEGAYLLSLVGMVIFLIILSFQQNAAFWHDPPSTLTVRVTAFQWCWRFQYQGQRTAVAGRCGGGPVPTLVVPSGRAVRYELTSRDVVHSFWIPALRFKMDIYPDHVNTFTMTVRTGRWRGRCAQYCGLYHYGMAFYIQAIPPAQFNRWLHAHGGPAHAVAGA